MQLRAIRGKRKTTLAGTGRLVWAGLLVALLLLAAPAELLGCPNCKNALRAGVERAYAASILFLLGVPFALLGAWGVAIHRLVRRRG